MEDLKTQQTIVTLAAEKRTLILQMRPRASVLSENEHTQALQRCMVGILYGTVDV